MAEVIQFPGVEPDKSAADRVASVLEGVPLEATEVVAVAWLPGGKIWMGFSTNEGTVPNFLLDHAKQAVLSRSVVLKTTEG